MFLRQLHLIAAALTCSLSAISSYLYQEPYLKGVAVLGLLWSIYGCYKIISFNLNSDIPAEKLINKEEPHSTQVDMIGQKQPEILPRNQYAPHNINKELNAVIKKEPIISKNLKQVSKI
jgi:hypothetical protein